MRPIDQNAMDAILRYVNDYYRENHTSPTIRQISEATGVSKSKTQRCVVDMKERGIFEYNRGISSAPKSAKVKTSYISAPVVGSIQCGSPEQEEEMVEEYVSLPVSIFGKGDYYILRAKGDSMVDAGIEEDDLIVVERNCDVSEGDIVVALDDCGENTLKRFGGYDPEEECFLLQYENEAVYPGRVIKVPAFEVQGVCIDLKSFYASVECVARELDPLTTNLVVADKERTDKTICLAVTPSLKAYGISGRARLFEVVQRVEEINRYRRSKAPGRKLDGESYDDPELKRNPSLALSYIVAPPRMSYYMETSARIYDVYLKFIAPEDIHVYSIDEVFIDLTPYLKTYQKTPREMAEMLIKEVLTTTGITATAGIGTNMYLAKVAMDITAKKMPADENGVRIAELDEMSYRRELWTHRPLTDFWMVGRGISKKLEDNYMFTMGDVARCSQYNEAKVGTEITEGENELWL